MFRQRKERLVFLKAHETCVRENKRDMKEIRDMCS